MQQSLYEQYRPQSWDQVVAQHKAIKKLQTVAQRGLTGKAFWISGKSGCGKTTIARLLAAEVAGEWYIEELDSADLTPARLRELESALHLSAPPPGGRAVIVNEAHGLRKDTVRQLLVLLERLPGHVVVVFTTTVEGETLFEDIEDSHPLLSRCIRIPLAQRGLAEAFAKRCQEIAAAEGLDGKESRAYVRLANDCNGNFRAMLQAVEAGDMLG